MPENAEIKQQQKNNITNLVIATRIKEELTPNKSESQRKNYCQKGKQTTAQKIANKRAICACNTEAHLASGDNNIFGDT